jgi:hypothetical protein
MVYDHDTQFKENNTTSYLAELEEYIAMLITYTAYAQELPDAAVSALSLDKMIPKRDLENQGPLNVRSFFNLIITALFRLKRHLRMMSPSRRPMMWKPMRMMLSQWV